MQVTLRQAQDDLCEALTDPTASLQGGVGDQLIWNSFFILRVKFGVSRPEAAGFVAA
jgi:hypothetical protein